MLLTKDACLLPTMHRIAPQNKEFLMQNVDRRASLLRNLGLESLFYLSCYSPASIVIPYTEKIFCKDFENVIS